MLGQNTEEKELSCHGGGNAIEGWSHRDMPETGSSEWEPCYQLTLLSVNPPRTDQDHINLMAGLPKHLPYLKKFKNLFSTLSFYLEIFLP